MTEMTGDGDDADNADNDGDGNVQYVEFPGIYQGFNLHSKAYILMTREHRNKLENARETAKHRMDRNHKKEITLKNTEKSLSTPKKSEDDIQGIDNVLSPQSST